MKKLLLKIYAWVVINYQQNNYNKNWDLLFSELLDKYEFTDVYDSNIFNVRDNAIVQDVWGNATVQDVWGNAVVQNVWDNATYRIIRFGEKPKLFMKKDTYTIVEL